MHFLKDPEMLWAIAGFRHHLKFPFKYLECIGFCQLPRNWRKQVEHRVARKSPWLVDLLPSALYISLQKRRAKTYLYVLSCWSHPSSQLESVLCPWIQGVVFFYFCLPSVSIMAFVVGKDFAFSICSNIILHTSQLHGNNWIMMIKVGETPMSCRP